MSDRLDATQTTETLLKALFAFDNITLHKRGKTWTAKIHANGHWISHTSENLYVSVFIAAQKVLIDAK